MVQRRIGYNRCYKCNIQIETIQWVRFGNPWKKKIVPETVLFSWDFQIVISNVFIQYYSYFCEHNTRHTNDIPLIKVKHNVFQNSFFPSVVIQWNKLEQNICNEESLNIFKNIFLNFIRRSWSTVFNCHNLKGVNLLIRLRLGWSHLREHSSFQDSLNPRCSCGKEIEPSAHVFFRCPNIQNKDELFLIL